MVTAPKVFMRLTGETYIKEKLVFETLAKGKRKVIWLVGWRKTSWKRGQVNWVL